MTLDLRGFSLARKTLTVASGLFFLLGVNGSAMSREIHGVHTHGLASATVAIENGALEIELEAPAISVLGFEHKPNNQEQMAVIDKASATLSSAENIVIVKGTSCSVENVNIDIHGPAGQAIESASNQEDDHHHSDADHSDEHHSDEDHSDEDHSDEHHSDEGHSDGNKENHSEILIRYQFSCVDGEQIRSIEFNLFEAFSGLESINTNWVTATQQGQAILRHGSSVIEFK